MKNTRRTFIKNAISGGIVLGIGGLAPAFSAKSYRQIVGANEKIRVAVMGGIVEAWQLVKILPNRRTVK